ncbi:MAG TPA: hypothetical protein VLB44_18100, partial [Kofleriaceae bacterium]|nr:hypothetical protein [Kofleriaceae bacterium]
MNRLAAAAILLGSATAHAYMTGPALTLDDLMRKADLVCKVTATADAIVTDASFDKASAFRVHGTQLDVATCFKGTAKHGHFEFRHYATGPTEPAMFEPQHYEFEVGGTYIVFAKASASGGTYRSIATWPTVKVDADAVRIADLQVAANAKLGDVVFAGLVGLVGSKDPKAAIEGIRQLNEMSGGRALDLKDFARAPALAAIAPALANPDASVA